MCPESKIPTIIGGKNPSASINSAYKIEKFELTNT